MSSSLCFVCHELSLCLVCTLMSWSQRFVFHKFILVLRLSWVHHCALLSWAHHFASSVISSWLCFVCHELINFPSSVMISSLCFVCHEFIIVLRLPWVHLCASSVMSSSVMSSSLCFVCNEFISVLHLAWVHHWQLHLSWVHLCASSVMSSSFVLRLSWVHHLCFICHEFIFVLRLWWVHHCVSSVMSSPFAGTNEAENPSLLNLFQPLQTVIVYNDAQDCRQTGTVRLKETVSRDE